MKNPFDYSKIIEFRYNLDWKAQLQEYYNLKDSKAMMAINTLSLSDKVLFLIYAEFYNVRETAEFFQVSEFTLYKHINRIKKYLRRKICSL